MVNIGESEAIMINRSLSGVKFPYGNLPKDNATFVEQNIGKVFTAVRHNINFYRTECGQLVHIYNARPA